MSQRLTSKSNLNFDEMTTLIHQLVNASWGENWGKFVASFPSGMKTEHIDLPIITYQLDEMVPGKMGAGNTQEIKPRFRETIDFGDGEGGTDVYGQFFDCTVTFECWDQGNAKATKLAMDFIELMNVYKSYLMESGVGNIVFKKMSNNGSSQKVQDDAASRVLEYSVRLEQITLINYDVIKRITGTVSQMRDDDGTKELFPFYLPKEEEKD